MGHLIFLHEMHAMFYRENMVACDFWGNNKELLVLTYWISLKVAETRMQYNYYRISSLKFFHGQQDKIYFHYHFMIYCI